MANFLPARPTPAQQLHVVLRVWTGDTQTYASIAAALGEEYVIEIVEDDAQPTVRSADVTLLAVAAQKADAERIGMLRQLAVRATASGIVPIVLIQRTAADEFFGDASLDVVGVPFAAAELRARIRMNIQLAGLRRGAMAAAVDGRTVDAESTASTVRFRHAEARDRFLVTLDDAVRPLDDPSTIVAISARLLGEHLGVDRCAYAVIEADQDTMNLTGNYCRHPGIVDLAGGRSTFTSFGSEVLALMRANRPYIVDDVDAHQPPVGDPSAYRAMQIQSVICVPLHKAGRFVAAMAVHCAKSRHWHANEAELLRTVANRCWEAIERARVTRDLLASEQRLGLAQRAGRVGVFDWFIADDRIIWSPELEALYGLPPGAFRGNLAGWSDRVDPADAARVIAEIRAAADAQQPSIDYEFRARVQSASGSGAAQLRWFAGQASIVYDESTGQPRRMIGVNIDIDDRKRAANELDRTRRRLDETLRAAEVGTWEYDVATDASVIDANLARIFGRDGFAPGVVHADAGPHEQIHPDDVEQHVAAVQAALAGTTGDVFETEHRIVRRDGAIRWVNSRGTVARDPASGKPLRMSGVALDVTARRDAEDAMRISEARYRSVVEATSQIVCVTTAEGLLTEGSTSWGNYTGQAPVAYAGTGWADAIHPDDLPRVIREWDDVVARGVATFAHEYRLKHRSGAYRRVQSRCVLIPAAHGHPREWVATVTDVEDTRSAADALAHSELRFRRLADSLPQLTWTAQPDGRRDWFNRRWEEYTGLSAAQLLDDDARAGIYRPEYFEIARQEWQAAAASGEPFETELSIRGVDGTFRTFLVRCEPLRDDRGTLTQWIGTCTDIEHRRVLLETERKARAEAERVGQMKDEFLATLSHELRTPLNAILGWSQLLQRGTLRDSEIRPAIATIERNARAQTQMIEDLLDMSRIVSGKVRLDVQRVDLAEVVTASMHAMEPTAGGRQVRMEQILDPLAGHVSGDPARLQQVIWNLLSNAIKFTPANGKVQVVLERVNSHIELSVSDTGVGIHPEFLPFVFDRFRQADASSTRQFGGLGLGLSIVRQLVELHGGTVRAKSPGPGHGATFIVALPLAVTHEPAAGRDHPRSASGSQPNVEESPSLAGLTALVVDDEPDARELVRRLLEDGHARVLTAASADEALQMVESERPDVLLSDIGMPRVDGYELIRRIRALGTPHGGGVPAIALTAFARSDDRRRALLAGFQSHVVKPTEAAELVAVVASVTGRTGVQIV